MNYNLSCEIFAYCRKGKTMVEQNEKWINIEEAAQHLDVKPATVRSWLRKENNLPAHKVGKQWKFKISELDEWVKSGNSANI